jgi:eukaryotic-like serine/threonine-protein kinase
VAAERQDVEPESDISPQQIGGFRVLRRLASGATTDVLLARAEGPDGFERVVALKVLLVQSRNDPELETLFAREAAAYARLSHPAIVKLYDFFTADGQLVMVLEYVDGLPLHKLRATLSIGGERLEDSAALFIGSRIFAALAAAHSARDPVSGDFSPVIHRDINPSNVLVPWDGHVRVSDFGISKLSDAQGDMRMGFVKGTYGYMAPEQVRGEAVTVRSDVYAATLILWELLTRRKAIQRGSLSEAEVLKAIARPEFPALDTIRPDMIVEVREAVRRGLEVDPDRRVVTAEEMANVLRKAMNADEGRLSLADAISRVRPLPASERVFSAVAQAVTTLPLSPSAPVNETPAAVSVTPPVAASELDSAASPVEPKAKSPPGDLDSTPASPTVADPPAIADGPGSKGSPSPPAAGARGEASLLEPPLPATPAAPLVKAAEPRPSPGGRSPDPKTLPDLKALGAQPQDPRASQKSPNVVLLSGAALGLALIVIGGFRLYVHEQERGVPAASPPASAVAPPPVAVASAPAGVTSPSTGTSTTLSSAPLSVTGVTTASATSMPDPAVVMLQPDAGPPDAASSSASKTAVATAVAAPRPLAPGQGALLTDAVAGSHRIFVDGRVVGESPSPAVVSCGTHTVQVGSAGTARSIQVPCGGSISVSP